MGASTTDPFKTMEEGRLRSLEIANKCERDIRELKRLMKEYDLVLVTAPDYIRKPLSASRRARQELFEAVRTILEGQSGARISFRKLYDQLKASGVQIGGVNDYNYLALYLHQTPCFKKEKKDERGDGGWIYDNHQIDTHSSTWNAL